MLIVLVLSAVLYWLVRSRWTREARQKQLGHEAKRTFRQRLFVFLKWYAIAVLVLKPMAYVVFEIKGRWWPPVEARLDDGRVIRYWSRPHGRETDELLEVVQHDEVRHYVINDYHALGALYVTLRRSNNGGLLWAEGKGRVLCSLDLNTGQFWREGVAQPYGAELGQGTVVGEGWAVRWVELLLPF